MLQKNYEGNSLPIEEIFHTISTRLFNLQRGNLKHTSDFDSPEECINNIRDNILGYEPTTALRQCLLIQASIKEISDISEQIINKLPIIQDSWEKVPDEIFYQTKLEEFNHELDVYNNFFLDLIAHLSKIIDTDFHTIKIEKTKTILTVPQFSYLLRLLLDERDGIFEKPNKTLLVTNISQIFQSLGSNNISPKSLYNHISDNEPSVMDFWKTKLSRFRQICDAELNKKRS